MPDRDRIIDQIYQAIDEVNLQLPPDRQVAKGERTLLIGNTGALDSLTFLNFIVTTEEKINSSFNVAIPLASSLMEAEKVLLPTNIADLADMICRRLGSYING